MIFFKKKFDRKVYGWKRSDGQPNVGDELAIKVVKQILLSRDIAFDEFVDDNSQKLLSIGSVLHFAKDCDVVWGTGVNGKINPKEHKFNLLDVRAVRGPRTKFFLEERGIKVPDTFGDPALLCPLLMPISLFVDLPPVQEFLIIPHMSEVERMKAKYGKDNICSPLDHPYNFIRKILSAKLVYSSSLHGIILAEAYNIPVVWFKSDNGENDFKYYDYYEGTLRYSSVDSFELDEVTCLRFEKIKNLDHIQNELLKSFPFDMWKKK